MAQSNKSLFVGLDVHPDAIVAAVAEAGRAQARVVARVGHEWAALRKVLRRLGPAAESLCCYEAGPNRVRAGQDVTRLGVGLRRGRAVTDPEEAPGTDQDRPPRRG